MNHALTFALCAGLCVAGTASAQQRDNSIGGAFSQPLRDIGFVRETPAQILQRASAAPYAVPANCTSIISEIIALDFALGPDVDTPVDHGIHANNLLAGAIRSAVSLPYRGVVRRLSGAEHREHVMQDAGRAGMARRAFLKGLRMRDCVPAEIEAPRREMADAMELAPSYAPQTMMASAPEAAPAPQIVAVSAPVSPPTSHVDTHMVTLAATEPEPVSAH